MRPEKEETVQRNPERRHRSHGLTPALLALSLPPTKKKTRETLKAALEFNERWSEEPNSVLRIQGSRGPQNSRAEEHRREGANWTERNFEADCASEGP